jgi:isochorismate synthase
MDSDVLFNKIDLQYSLLLPFVVYRKPNSNAVLALLQKDAFCYTTAEYSESGFVFAHFDNKKASILIPLEQSEQFSVIPAKAGISVIKTKSPIAENVSDRVFHINLIQKGIDSIKNSDLSKVVLSRTETIKLSESNPLQFFKRLLSNYPSAFVYCFYHPEVGTWLGATPETLLKIEGNQFFTTALAGTQKFEGKLDVEWNPKEIEEQNIVTNFIIENLQPLTSNLKVENVETTKAGSLLHLKTNISGTIDFKTLNLKQMLQTLHPTPAVCGFPKQSAKQFILENENYNREFYTGFLGELNLKEKTFRNSNRHNIENDAYATLKTVSNLFVNLRCMKLKSSEAILYVGGGITKDSKPEDEWKETVNKTQTIKSVL